MPEPADTEVPLLRGILANLGGANPADTEVPLLRQIVQTYGASNPSDTEVPELKEWLDGAGGDAGNGGDTEVPILASLYNLLGGPAPIPDTEVPLLRGVYSATLTPASIYADSVAGDDGNDGLSSATPVRTLAEAQTKATANSLKSFKLKRGSHWREDLDLSGVSRADVGIYGESGDPPLIDGSDIVASWTLSAGNVWQASVAHFVGTSDYGRVYEDGAVMTRVADESTCNATPGSYVALFDSAASPWTVKIHPSDSGNPNSNGKTYEVTVRKQAAQLNADDSTLTGVWTTKSISNNGSTELGLGGTMRRLMMTDGTKHNALIGSGTVEDVLMKGKQVIEGSDYIVVFTASGPGKTSAFKRVGVSDIGNNSASPTNYSHDLGATAYDSASMEQCWSVGAATGWGMYAVDQCSAEGLYAKDCASHSAFSGASAVDIQRMLVNRAASGQLGIGFAGPADITIRNSVFYLGNSVDYLLRPGAPFDGGTITLENCIILAPYIDPVTASSASLVGSEGWTSGTITIRKCIFVGFPYGSSYAFGFGPTFVSEENVFGGRLDGTGSTFLHTVEGYKTLAQMQALGMETDSLMLDLTGGGKPWSDLFLGDTAAGDFRLNPETDAGAAAIALEAGPQSHWDWNARAVVSGPPEKWPVLPLSEDQYKAYILDPAAWDFYADDALLLGDGVSFLLLGGTTDRLLLAT